MPRAAHLDARVYNVVEMNLHETARGGSAFAVTGGNVLTVSDGDDPVVVVWAKAGVHPVP